MRKIGLLFVLCLLSTVVVCGQTHGANTDALRKTLQLKLDEWHKASASR